MRQDEKTAMRRGVEPGPPRGDGGSAATTVETPLGPMTLGATERGLAMARFEEWSEGPATRRPAGTPAMSTDAERAAHAVLAKAVAAIETYFAGDGAVEDLPDLDLVGTDMQVEVWRELLTIPAGVTRTYREIAEAIGRPTAVRAIGAAIGANPVGVLVPCHRVIGADGSFTGYAGGLERKRWLLAHEGAALAL
ncbi:methylated-DNA--[protein]-cysteine S-methyltransferase [Demequina sp. NBRC 110054]|uniref:methylated-DNA--[protein]-cysteine S-methyltransferase n=1 Tax=Demequina sp. NBRC 110054 TaxID=1570343 RepID=UPI0026F43596|nr:methylated-DNA--[protein]-cysteine S-methyltransferase [Demequina sp. NBRC 110054]